ADTTQVCQGVYDALIKEGASSRGVGSVIALAAADVMQAVGDGDRDAFVQAAHGLLFSAAVRLVYAHVQDIPALPLLFTSGIYQCLAKSHWAAGEHRANAYSWLNVWQWLDCSITTG